MPADGDHSHKRARSIDSEGPSVRMKRLRIQTARKTTGGKPPRDGRTHKAVQVGAINGASLQEGGPSLHRTRALPPSPESVSSQGGQEIASVHEKVRDSNGRELTRSQRAREDEEEEEEEDTTEDVVPQAAQGPGRRKRYRPSAEALRGIRKYRRTTDIPMSPFVQVVREIALNMAPADVPAFRWQATALQALQAAAEAYLVHMFEQGYLCTLHAKRKTLMVKDIQLARRLGRRM